MKKLLLIISVMISIAGHTQDLNGVTFGFGAGYRFFKKDIYDYSLSTDTFHNLQRQSLSKSSFVISSLISVKLGKLRVKPGTSQLQKQTQQKGSEQSADFWQRFSINTALNLVEVQSSSIAFNKSIDGGLGLGFFLTDNIQIAAFYDYQTVRQLRDYISDTYLGKRIPNGSGFYNALDLNDNNLFYSKTITGFSFKLIFSVGNKKASSS